MSLNRISYLESWLHSPGAFLRQYQDHSSTDSDEDENAYQGLPDTSSSSSLSSIFYYPSPRDRQTFNPVGEPVLNEDVVEGTVRDNRDTGLREDALPVHFGSDGPDSFLAETTGAFEVGRRKRIVQVCMAVIYCFLSGGIIFGFAAIKQVLIKEGVYRDLCSDEEIHKGVSVCYGQEIRLNLMFTIAAVATNISALPVGAVLDTYGPRICGNIGSCLLAIGALFLAFAAHISSGSDAYITSYLLFALGGPFVYISSFHLSNAIPARSGLILAALNGAFDASSAIFLIFRAINEKTNGWFSTERFALVYLAIPLLIIAAQVSIMPATSYKTVGELVQQAETYITAESSDRVYGNIQDRNEGGRQRNYRRAHRQGVVSKIQDFLVENGDHEVASSIKTTIFDQGDHPGPRSTTSLLSNQRRRDAKPNKRTSGGVWGTLHGLSAPHQIRSPWFILITLFTILQLLRLNYFIASIRHQYEYLFASPNLARQFNETFDVLLPLGGLLAVPFVGAIIDNSSTPSVLMVLVTTAMVIGVLGCIPHSLVAGYANIVLFVLYRPFYYTAISDYAAKVFGFQTFGKVYGLMTCLAGLGNFAQAGLGMLTFKVFNQNPIPVNVTLTATTGLVGMVLVGFVWWRMRAIAAGAIVDGIEDGGMSFHDELYDDDDNVREQEPLLYRSNRPQHGIMIS